MWPSRLLFAGLLVTTLGACKEDVGRDGPEPGAPIDVGDPPGGYSTKVPGSADTTLCYTDQWWQEGDEESPNMHPGGDCIDCHQRKGEGPTYSYAGTVMGAIDDETDCRGIPGVTVELLDVDDVVFETMTTNAAGNFYTEARDVDFEEYRVVLTYDGRTREMAGHVDATGACAQCHTTAGAEAAPGRIVAP